MVDQEIQTIRKTWHAVSERKGNDINVLFFASLIEKSTNLPPGFQNDLRNQSRQFINMMDFIINKLDNANFIHDVRNIGKKYSTHGISEEHFEYIKQAFLSAMKTKLGDKWTPQVMVSWIWCFTMLRNIMKDNRLPRF